MKIGLLHFPYENGVHDMPEYESSKYPYRSTRIGWYASLVLASALLAASWHEFGSDVWLTRLLLLPFGLTLVGAFLQLIEHRRFVGISRRSDGWIEHGSKNLFWFNDRDPEDPRVV